MDKLRETCLDLLKTHNIQKNVIQPIICSIYNEIYLYIWFFFIYHLLFVIMILAIFYLVLRISYKINVSESFVNN